MTGTELAVLIRKKTKTTTNTYTDANLLIDANIFKNEIAGQISAVRNEAFNVQETDDLSDDVRSYGFKADVMNNLVRLELKFSSSNDYVPATGINQSDVRIAIQESIIVNSYDNLNPFYFVRGKYIYILSGAIVDVTDGIKWVYKKFPTDLANLTGSTDLSIWASATSPGMPKEFHELWAMRVTIEYKDINEIRLSSRENKYDRLLKTKIDNFKVPNLDSQFIGALPPASRRGDDGWDY